jgi:hypothetical protein
MACYALRLHFIQGEGVASQWLLNAVARKMALPIFTALGKSMNLMDVDRKLIMNMRFPITKHSQLCFHSLLLFIRIL